MREEIETKNAVIESTSLGGYDGGTSVMTCWLHLSYGGSGQGFGGYGLDEPYGDRAGIRNRRGTAYGMEFITRIIATVGVDKWEDLPGKHIRVKAGYDKVIAIGHIIEDRWFEPQKDLASFIPKEKVPA